MFEKAPSDDAADAGRRPKIRCVECAAVVEARFSKDGEYCFECAVHAACACADPTDLL